MKISEKCKTLLFSPFEKIEIEYYIVKIIFINFYIYIYKFDFLKINF